MGVSVHVLESQSVILEVGGTFAEVGVVRYSGKVTEGAASAVRNVSPPSPVAVLVAETLDLPSKGNTLDGTVKARRVLGWDEGRMMVTDLDWDHLPTLGYAVRNPSNSGYILNELHNGALRPIDSARAGDLNLVRDGQLLRHGQPRIAECQGVKTFSVGYAEADCVLDNGLRAAVLIRATEGLLPDPVDLVGLRLRDAQEHHWCPK